MPNQVIFLIAMAVDITAVFVSARRGVEWLYGTILCNLILIGVFGAKLVLAFGVPTNLGNGFYACVFLATYFLLEKHGRQAGFKTIWYGLFYIGFFALFSQLAVHSKGLSQSENINQALNNVFVFSPRVFFGSMLAFIFAQNINVLVYSWIKEKTKGKHLWLRINVANISAQLLDSALFFSVAFIDLPGSMLVQAILAGWAVKTLVVLLGTPLLYLSAYLDKK